MTLALLIHNYFTWHDFPYFIRLPVLGYTGLMSKVDIINSGRVHLSWIIKFKSRYDINLTMSTKHNIFHFSGVADTVMMN